MKIIIKEKQEIEAALNIAIPILSTAKESLNELDKAEISEVRYEFPLIKLQITLVFFITFVL